MKQQDAETLKWCTDACARCDHINRPWHVSPKGKDYIRADYECGKCPHKWFTTWQLEFAINHALDAKYCADHPEN